MIFEQDLKTCDPNARGLLITELMPNPAGRDRGQEWIEFYNASDRDFVMNRLHLEVEHEGKIHDTELTFVGVLPPRHYLVAGDAQQAHADIAYTKLRLPNDAAILRVRCQNKIITDVSYGSNNKSDEEHLAPTPLPGRSLCRTLETIAGRAAWFSTFEPKYDNYNYGTPGQKNTACFVCQRQDGEQDKQIEQQTWRAVVSPARSQVRLHSILADPVGPDPGNEWLVLYNTSAQDVDLNGLVIQAVAENKPTRTWRLVSKACQRLQGYSVVTVYFSGLSAKFIDAYDPQTHPIVLHGATIPNQRLTMHLSVESPSVCQVQTKEFDRVDVPDAKMGIAWHRHPDCYQAGCSDGFYRTDWPSPSSSMPTMP